MKSSVFAGIAAATMLAHAATQDVAGLILTPRPGPAPSIHGPKVYGARPGKPFLYRIPCTGTRPIRFVAEGLPPSLKLDPATGIINGTTPAKPGEHLITFRASNAKGKSTRTLKLKVGDSLALTPPMGWNDWYAHYGEVTDKLMRHAADTLISTGMADFGYNYVNIDDCWMVKPDSTDPQLGGPPRAADGSILTNRRFPDMKALTDYIHSKGLKAGIYTSPGPLTCAKFEGAYQHEEQDARQFAAWGFDFLKYDRCSYARVAPDKSDASEQKPYRQMGAILKDLPRDIVFNLCQYGVNQVWKWGGEVGGHAWRTTGDVGLSKDSDLPGFYPIGFENARWWEYAGPGRWNDPDYLLIGHIGNPRKPGVPSEPSKLSVDEQYSYMSMWALMASPLFYSGDMAKLDDLTLSILCNAEVIDVNQDSLGKQARIVRKTKEEFLLAKPLDDGSLAVGLFNLTRERREVEATWGDLQIQGPHHLRDLWRQKDTPGLVNGKLTATIEPHGVMLFRIKN